MALRRLVFGSLLVPLLACGSSNGRSPSARGDDALVALGEADVLADLTTLGNTLAVLYAPLAQRQAAGFDLDRELAAAHDAVHAATTERERLRPLFALVGKLQDPGLTLSDGAPHGDDAVGATLPLTLFAAEGRYVVRSGPAPLHAGDVLVAIDGVAVADLEAAARPFAPSRLPAAIANGVARILVSRPYWAPDTLRPRGATAHVEATSATGAAVVLDLAWTPGQTLDDQVTATVADADAFAAAPPEAPDTAPPPPATAAFDPDALGTPAPDYWTPSVAKAFPFTDAAPTDATLAAISPAAASNRAQFLGLVAKKIMVGGKNLLLVRIPSFSLSVPEALGELDWLRALLTDEKPDAVILDVTNDAGGAQSYMAGVASMFLAKPVANATGALHADRTNLTDLVQMAATASPGGKARIAERIADLDGAIDAGRPLAGWQPLAGLALGTGLAPGDAAYGVALLAPHPSVHYAGPILVLQNERTSGIAEAFARILQNAGAKTFGARSAGLGSSQQAFVTLPHSQLRVRVPRGLLSVPSADLATQRPLLDEGVSPDIVHDRTIAEIVGGNVDLVSAFLNAASTLTR